MTVDIVTVYGILHYVGAECSTTQPAVRRTTTAPVLSGIQLGYRSITVERRPPTVRIPIVTARSFPHIIEHTSRMWPTSA